MMDTEELYGPPDTEAILAALVSNNVDFVVVGGTAAIQHGATRATSDVDRVVATTTENLQRPRLFGRNTVRLPYNCEDTTLDSD